MHGLHLYIGFMAFSICMHVATICSFVYTTGMSPYKAVFGQDSNLSKLTCPKYLVQSTK